MCELHIVCVLWLYRCSCSGDAAFKQPEVARLQNPCRVVPGQEAFMRLELPTSQWIPIDPERRAGIVMLRRKQPINSEANAATVEGIKTDES